VDHYANLHQQRFICFQNILFTSLVVDEQMDEWMEGQTNRQVENIMPPPASLASTCQSGLAEALKLISAINPERSQLYFATTYVLRLD